MGRHHADFRMGVGADGSSYLPAFDTMMRVLSLGTSSFGATGPHAGANGQKSDNCEKNNNQTKKARPNLCDEKLLEEDENLENYTETGK